MKNFNTYISEKLKITKHMINNQHNGYECVDLDLPSGTLWAKCNVGANEEYEYGDYFAWGEIKTKPKKNYDWKTYKYCDGGSEELTKYCSSKANGHNEFTDNIRQIEPEDDAAHVNMGGKWCIPTEEQFQELIDNTTNEWVNNYNNTGKNGRLLTSKQNNNTIFFPAGGLIYKYERLINKSGVYWASTVYEPNYDDDAICLHFRDARLFTGVQNRSNGALIRPVLNK